MLPGERRRLRILVFIFSAANVVARNAQGLAPDLFSARIPGMDADLRDKFHSLLFSYSAAKATHDERQALVQVTSAMTLVPKRDSSQLDRCRF